MNSRKSLPTIYVTYSCKHYTVILATVNNTHYLTGKSYFSLMYKRSYVLHIVIIDWRCIEVVFVVWIISLMILCPLINHSVVSSVFRLLLSSLDVTHERKWGIEFKGREGEEVEREAVWIWVSSDVKLYIRSQPVRSRWPSEGRGGWLLVDWEHCWWPFVEMGGSDRGLYCTL